MVERRAEDPIIPLSLFKNRIFVNATAIGFTLGLGMFSAIAFVPTFLQMSSGTSAAESGLLMLPMMVGLMGTSIYSGIRISKTGKYKMFPILGAAFTMAAMLWMTTLTAATPIWVICVQLFIFGAGLGLIMQVMVLVVQNSVPADQIGTATSTNNYFREVGAAMGVAVFGAIFTNRLSESLTNAFTGAGASAAQASQSTSSLDPQALSQLPEQLRDAIVNAYAESLAPVFWYLIPFIAVALLLAITLKQIPLSDTAGMVARGEAVGGEEAERLEAERLRGLRHGRGGHHKSYRMPQQVTCLRCHKRPAGAPQHWGLRRPCFRPGRSTSRPSQAGSSMAAAAPASMNGPNGMADFSVPRRAASRASDQRPPSRKAAKVPANTCAQPR